jgi:hypothetical protein
MVGSAFDPRIRQIGYVEFLRKQKMNALDTSISSPPEACIPSVCRKFAGGLRTTATSLMVLCRKSSLLAAGATVILVSLQPPLSVYLGDPIPISLPKLPFRTVVVLSIDPSQIAVGVELYVSNSVKCVVTQVTDTGFTIDAYH